VGIFFYEAVKDQEHEEVEKKADGVANDSGEIDLELVHVAVFVQIFFNVQDLYGAGGGLHEKVP
jgi:hypothetical protein